jgi:hypothetical protein
LNKRNERKQEKKNRHAQTNKHKQTHTHTANKQTSKQANKQTSKQANKQTNTQHKKQATHHIKIHIASSINLDPYANAFAQFPVLNSQQTDDTWKRGFLGSEIVRTK